MGSPKKNYSNDKSKSGGFRKKFNDKGAFKKGRPKFRRDDEGSGEGDYKKKSYGDGDSREKKYGGDRDKKPFFKKDGDNSGYKKKSYGDSDSREKKYGGDRDKKPFFKKDGDNSGYKKKSYGDSDSREKKYGGDRDKKPFFKKDGESSGYKKKSYSDSESGGRKFSNDRDKKPFFKKDGESSGYKKKSYGDDSKKPFEKRTPSFFDKNEPKSDEKKPFNQKRTFAKKSVIDKEYKSDEEFDFNEYKKEKKREGFAKKEYTNTEKKWREKKKFDKKQTEGGEEFIRLNKYIANTGACSRREADQLIATGVVTVNGKIVTELGTKIRYTDKVTYGGQSLKREENVYLLLNKPKDYITTVDDPQNRRTVMDLVAGACKERIYPVGRLDRNTTGLLLFTNDGELTKKLTHPSYNIKKIYHVMTDQNVSKEDMAKCREGFELEDGYVKVDDIDFVGDSTNKRDIGVEIHSGRNRIVRRMFEHLGYKVIKLDRVMFAGLTKKDLPRGRYRFLTTKEVAFLKML